MITDQQGATSILMLLAIFVLFGSAMIAIDAGSIWTARRHLITGTDAAAHGAALTYAENHSCAGSGRSTAAALLHDNVPAANLAGYEVDCSGGGGTVRVSADQAASVFFAPLFGHDSAEVTAASLAEWGGLTAAKAVRPIAFCYYDDHIQEWIASGGGATEGYRSLRGVDDPATDYPDHPTYDGAGVVHRIPFTKDMDPRCGDPPGSWGWLDFDGNAGANGASALRDRIDRGYEGAVDLGSDAAGDENCDGRPGGTRDCPGETGANASTDRAVDDVLVCAGGTATAACPAYLVVVHDRAVKSGGQRLFHPAGFLGIVVRGAHKVNAKQGWFDLEFTRFAAQGSVGPHHNGGVPGPFGVELCGTEFGGTNDDHCDY